MRVAVQRPVHNFNFKAFSAHLYTFWNFEKTRFITIVNSSYIYQSKKQRLDEYTHLKLINSMTSNYILSGLIIILNLCRDR